MLRSPPLTKMASTHCGMRRILKKRLPVPKYIEMAVKSGSYRYPSNRPHYLGLHDTRNNKLNARGMDSMGSMGSMGGMGGMDGMDVDLRDVPNPDGTYDRDNIMGQKKFLTRRERDEITKWKRGILDFPTEYEILTRNPPLPDIPRTPVRVRKRLAADRKRVLQREKKVREKRELLKVLDERDGIVRSESEYEALGLGKDEKEDLQLPSMDRLVKSYLRRHENKLRGGMSPSQSKREEEYYNKLLIGSNFGEEGGGSGRKPLSQTAFLSPSTQRTAMGRKAMLVENAYAFALRQQQVMLKGKDIEEGEDPMNGIVTEEESIAQVEEILRQEARKNRLQGHDTTKSIQEWRNDQSDADTQTKDSSATADSTDSTSDEQPDPTIPSILHSRPRAIRALSIWSSRLQSIPYHRWTIGAATALDHWIAREVLQMDEHTWQRVLEGGGTDAYVTLETNGGVDDKGEILGGAGETKTGVMDRMRDIVAVRGALFPETLMGSEAVSEGESESGEGLSGELEEELLEEKSSEKSIDELLATLGGLDDDYDKDSWKFEDEDEKKEGEEAVEGEGNMEAYESIIDELQNWRERNASSPYEAWDVDRKKEFDQWIEKYVATLSPEAKPTSIDKEATRQALLSKGPMDPNQTKDFWTKLRTESEAEGFLQDYRARAQEKLSSLEEASTEYTLSEGDKALQTQLRTLLSVPYDRQLRKLVDMGTLRPLLDEYTQTTERNAFFERYTPLFLEGLEMEHLVPDAEGPIGLEDLSPDLKEELSQQWSQSLLSGGALMTGGSGEPRFAIEMIAYGTDEFGSSRAERARDLYRLWNEHKANRARFEEAMFKKGMLGLEEKRVPGGRKSKKERMKEMLNDPSKK